MNANERQQQQQSKERQLLLRNTPATPALKFGVT
jgi:hypothetical protein